MPREQALIAEVRASTNQEFDVVLKPISHPELGDIRIDENLFAIGRGEPPFASYEREVVAELSRRQARIFSENGAVYIADLDSKNGTTVNGIQVKQKPARLRHGDEICFGGVLSYRVELIARTSAIAAAERLLSLTLTPERDDLGLLPIVIGRFPFLISKTDNTFSRYRNEYPHQVNYLSRRHAHFFLRGGMPLVEDLGSTNGTFVSGNRLEEHAVPLKDGETIAFGGSHFVYTVGLQWAAEPEPKVEIDSTVTKLAMSAPRAAGDAFESDKTTFIAAAGSFLDIFCVEGGAQQRDDEVNCEAQQEAAPATEAKSRRGSSRRAIFLAELTDAFAGTDRAGLKRGLRWGAVVAAVLIAVGLGLYFKASPERELKDLLAASEYSQAFAVADEALQRDPNNSHLMAMGTEALLKATVPEWLARLKARDFARARATLVEMKPKGARLSEAQSLIDQLRWIGDLEEFVIGRGGVDAPIRIYADEGKIKALLQRWNEDATAHQRALLKISTFVPEFKEPYAQALSHLRRLESDESVYLAAIERLNTTVGEELSRGRAELLEGVLNDYAEKYPRLAGLESLRKDVQQYAEVERAVGDRKLGPLTDLIAKTQFATPPVQAQFRKLAESRLPSPDVVSRYQSVAAAWRKGDANQAMAALGQISAGEWAEVVAKDLEHKKAVASQFQELQRARGSKGYEERLLTFYGLLDAADDTYFVRATEADVGTYKGKALGRAQELVARAQTQWRQYRENGAIAGSQRLESGISATFRSQARLLTDAQAAVAQGMRTYELLKADKPADSIKLQEEIGAEADMQRRSLKELNRVLEPELLKAKLALIGERNSEERAAP